MTEPTTIHLIRHAETIWNAEGRCQGHGDAPFTELGKQQLNALAASMRAVHFDAAYSSPLVRARQTAEAVLRGRGLVAATVDDLAELHYGALQGTLFTDWPSDLLAVWRNHRGPSRSTAANHSTTCADVVRRHSGASSQGTQASPS